MEYLKPGLAVTTRSGQLHIWSYKSASERDLEAERIGQLDYAGSVENCDVRTHSWATPNRISIATGCKTFDHQCSSIITGNVIANTFLSFYIRPRHELSCNGQTFAHGRLQARDLALFGHSDLHAGNVLEFVRQLPRAEVDQLMLTLVFHWATKDSRKTRVVHGAILTDEALKLVRRFDRPELGQTKRQASRQILDSVEPFLTDAKAINRQPIRVH